MLDMGFFLYGMEFARQGVSEESSCDTACQGAGRARIAVGKRRIDGSAALFAHIHHCSGTRPEGHDVKSGLVFGGTEITETVDFEKADGADAEAAEQAQSSEG